MSWTNLKSSIAQVVKANDNQEITGTNLQGVLNTIVDSVGENATFAGVAEPSTNPGTPDGPVFYITGEPGIYSNFNNVEVESGELVILVRNNSSWTKTLITNFGGGDADSISYDNTTSGLDATNVQDAIDELSDELSQASGNVGYDVISGSNVQLKNEEDAPVYPKTNLQMVDGYIAENYDKAYEWQPYTYKTERYVSNNVVVDSALPSSRSYDTKYIIFECECVAGETFRLNGVLAEGTNYNMIAEVDADNIVRAKTMLTEAPSNLEYTCKTTGKIIYQIGYNDASYLDRVSYLKKIDNDFTGMVNDRKYPIIVDIGEMVDEWAATTSYKQIIPVLTATATTATISSADATNMNMSAGARAKLVFHKVVDGNDVYKAYTVICNGTTLTLVNQEYGSLEGSTECCAISCDSLHMSPFGFRAWGQFIAEKVKERLNMRKDNLLGGLFFSQGSLKSVAYNDTRIQGATSSKDIIAPRLSQKYTLGGAIGSCGISTSSSRYAWGMTQTTLLGGKQKGQNKFFELQLNKLTGCEGYVQIECCRKSGDNDYAGTTRMDIYNGGEVILTATVPESRHTFRTGNIKADDLHIRFTYLDDANTQVLISHVAMYKMTDDMPIHTFGSKDKIAIIGASWTQYPLSTNPGIPADDPDNTIDTLADGRTADGYQYMAKELARQLGCTVDNYGKSGQTIEGYGYKKLKEALDAGRYEYVLVNMMINDFNQSRGEEHWMQDTWAMMDAIIAAGVTPILCTPCADPSATIEPWRYHMLAGDINLDYISQESYVIPDLEERWQNRKNKA